MNLGTSWYSFNVFCNLQVTILLCCANWFVIRIALYIVRFPGILTTLLQKLGWYFRCHITTIPKDCLILRNIQTPVSFYLNSLSWTILIHRGAGEGEDISLFPLYQFHLPQRHLDSWSIAVESWPLLIASRLKTQDATKTIK